MAGSKPVCVDMHVHFGLSRDGGKTTARDVQTFLSETPVSHMVLFGIDEPNPGPSYAKTNDKVARIAARDKRVTGFARLNPHQKQAAFDEIRKAVKRGFRGIKLHPRSDAFLPQQVEDIIEEAEKERLSVMLHTAHDLPAQPCLWTRIFLRHPRIYFILAHSGKDQYREAAAIARRHKNVFLDTSTLSYFRTSRLFHLAGPEKMVFASDAPYSHPAVEYFKFDLILGRNPRLKKMIFAENPKRILGNLS